MFLDTNKVRPSGLVSRADALKSVRNFLKNSSKPNVVPATDYGIAMGAGTLMMYDLDTPDDREFLSFPLTAYEDTSSDLVMNSGVLVMQDRLDVVHMFDQHYSSEGLVGAKMIDSQKYVFLGTHCKESFSVTMEVMQTSYSASALVSLMYKAAKKNIDIMYQKMFFDKILSHEEKEAKK